MANRDPTPNGEARVRIDTRVSAHEKYVRKTNPKRRNPYPSEIALLIRDVEHLVSCLEQGKLPSREWCLELANAQHPGYYRVDMLKKRQAYAAKRKAK